MAFGAAIAARHLVDAMNERSRWAVALVRGRSRRGVSGGALGVRRLAVVLVVPLLAGCPQRVYVWLNDRPTTGNLVFHIGSARGRPGGVSAAMLRVDRCAREIEYSRKPVWMVSLVRGADNLAFDVGSDGVVHEHESGD